MPEYEGLKYTVSMPKMNKCNTGQSKRIDARLKAVNWGLDKLKRWALSAETKHHLKPLRSKIEEYVNNGKVVLVIVQHQQWNSKDGAGAMRETVLNAHIGGVSDSRHHAYIIYDCQKKQPTIKPAPAPGWKYGSEIFMWFEDEAKQQEQKKTDVGNLYWETIL